jgi:membrane protein DedA with SNARE-associated domain
MHPHLHLYLQQLIQTYGYLGVFIGTFLEGDIVLVLGGFLSHQEYLRLPLVILTGFSGAILSDQFFFWLGRKRGPWLFKKLPRWQSKIELINKQLDKHGNWVAVVFRFVYGFRSVTPFVLGNSRIKSSTFVILNLTSALVWATTISVCGFLFGQVFGLFLQHMKRYEIRIILAIIAIGIIVKVLERWEIKRLG